MKHRRWLALTPLLLVAAACSDADAVTSGTIGEMGEGIFSYGCVGDGDAVCNETEAVSAEVEMDLGINNELPSAVAVGARFLLGYTGQFMTEGGEMLLLDVVPAQSEGVHDMGGFIITSPGQYAFLARSPKGVVADFTHLDALVPTELDVWKDESKVSSFDLTVGAETFLGVVPNDDVGIALAGALPYTWESSNADVLAVGAADSTGTPTSGVEVNDDEVRVVALAEGEVQLTVSRDDLVKQVTVTVTLEVTP